VELDIDIEVLLQRTAVTTKGDDDDNSENAFERRDIQAMMCCDMRLASRTKMAVVTSMRQADLRLPY
jgi:hypothetical protein